MKYRGWMIVTLWGVLALAGCTETPTPIATATVVAPTETLTPEAIETERASNTEVETTKWEIIFSACPCENNRDNSCANEHCVANIYSIAPNGKNLQQVVAGKYSASAPRPSPDGSYIAFEDMREEMSDQSEENGHGGIVHPHIYIFDISQQSILPLGIGAASSAQWFSEREKLAYLQDHNLYATDIVEDVTTQLTNFTESRVYDYALLPDSRGTIFLHQETSGTKTQELHIAEIIINDDELQPLTEIKVEARYSSLKLSPDGNRLLVTTAFSSAMPVRDLVIVEIATGETLHLFHSDLSIQAAEWLADSQSVLTVESDYVSNVSTFNKITVESGKKEEIFKLEGISRGLFGVLAPDKRHFVFSTFSLSETGNRGIFVGDIQRGTWKHILTNYQVNLDSISIRTIPPSQGKNE